jgi:hypothetical protein
MKAWMVCDDGNAHYAAAGALLCADGKPTSAFPSRSWVGTPPGCGGDLGTVPLCEACKDRLRGTTACLKCGKLKPIDPPQFGFCDGCVTA